MATSDPAASQNKVTYQMACKQVSLLKERLACANSRELKRELSDSVFYWEEMAARLEPDAELVDADESAETVWRRHCRSQNVLVHGSLYDARKAVADERTFKRFGASRKAEAACDG